MADGAVPQAIERAKPSFYGLSTAGGIMPQTFEDTWRIAETLAKSELVRKEFRNKPENVMLVMMQGQELGLKSIAALTQIYVVDGVPSLSSKLKLALVRTSPVCEYITCTHSDEKSATFKAKRRDQPQPVELTFTIQDAEAYGLLAKDNWKKRKVMLRWRAAGQICDLEFSDVIGAVQTYDEAQEMRERIVTGGSHVIRSGGAPTLVEVPEMVPDEADDDSAAPREQQAEEAGSAPSPAPTTTPGEMSEADKLHALIDSLEGEPLRKLADRVTSWPVKSEEIKLRQHYARRVNELKKAGK